MGQNLDVAYSYATVPAEILTGEDIVAGPLQRTDINVYLTLFTSMFMHAGWAHLGGNMLFLWIFGDNLEDEMGHFSYLLFYLLCGVLAGLAHVFSTVFFGQGGLAPSLGASGAISGVLGGYILQHPKRAVHLFMLFTIISVPAFIAVGLWFVFQVINSLGAQVEEEGGKVAYAAHIGGFIAGLILVKFLRNAWCPNANEK